MIKRPLAVSFEFCNYCNLFCKMCDLHFQNQHGPEKKFLSYSNWKNGLASLEKFKDRNLELTPHWIGEPLLHPRFNEFVKLAFDMNKKNKLFRHFQFSTNGVLIEKNIPTIFDCAEASDQKGDTFYYINFSLDAASDETYKKIKSVALLEKVKSNIIKILSIQKKRKISYPKIHLSFVVMKENCGEAKAFMDYWSSVFVEFGVDFVTDYKFPLKDTNAIYFRRLSDENQLEANEMHFNTVSQLGIIPKSTVNPFSKRGEF